MKFSVFLMCIVFLSIIPSLLHAQVPAVVSTSPSQNELAVSVSADIEVVFDVDMDATTINDTNFFAVGSYNGLYQGVISYDNPSRTATLDPSASFVTGETITVYLTRYIESSTGTPLAAGYSWKFETEVSKGSGHLVYNSTHSVGDQPKSICAADFNLDGNVDLATANYNDGFISILPGNGDGTFGTKSNYAAGSRPYALAAADFDGDNYIDIVTGNYFGGDVSIMLNNGDGTFIRDNQYSIGDQVTTVACADFNGDGYIDLAVGSNAGMTVVFNDGTAAFNVDTTYTEGYIPQSVSIGDIDNDGSVDIIAGNSGSNGLTLFYNDGNGKFISSINVPTGTSVWGMTIVDFDSDGSLDIATANGNDNSVTVLLNDGLGVMSIDDTYPAGIKTWVPVGNDFDGDGDIDLFSVNESSHNMYPLINNGDGTFTARSAYPCGITPSWGAAADFNNDGDIDIATSLFGRDSVYILSNVSGVVIGNNDDSGIGSFRWGLDSANTNPGSDTIVILADGQIELLTSLPPLVDDSLVISEAYSYYYGIHSLTIGSIAKAINGPGLAIESSHNTIEGLVLTGFSENGIEITGASSSNNTLSKNLVYGNGLLGIDLGDDGVTSNDPGDSDSGPNDLLNFPEIDSVLMNLDSTFRVYGRAADSAVIEFFVAHPEGDSTKPPDPSGYGEARQYIGSDTCDDGGGFLYEIPKTIAPFSQITATATDTLGNTSEFCENFVLTAAPLIIMSYSPVNLQVTDPVGDSIGRTSDGTEFNSIIQASYTETVDDYDSVHIDFPLLGEYIIDVITEDGADPGACYSIGIRIDGTANCIIVMEALVPAQGEVTSYSYEVEEGYHYINGDVDRNEIINILDIIYLIAYKFEHGPEPYPLYVADTDCDLIVNILDIIYLIDFKFKGGPEPCPLEE